VRTGVLERMAAAGEISMSDVKIIRSHPKEGFPLAHSTDLYPEWKLVVMPGTDPALARDVAGTLLQIAPERPWPNGPDTFTGRFRQVNSQSIC